MTSRILVIEDDEKSRRLLTDVLRYHDYVVDCFDNGEEGLRQAHLFRPAAALLDIQLPGISGFEILARLRVSEAAAIPVIAVTASVMDHDRKRILQAGFDAYVAKPVNIRELLDTVRALLAKVAT